MSDEPYTGDTSYRLPRGEGPTVPPNRPEIAGCALVQDLLPLYIDNEVSPESHALIADHLARCERCSGFLAGARSVRAQILDEETKVRAAFASAPAVAAVQQPVWSSPLATLWRFAMLLVWLAALAITLLSVVGGVPPGMVIGAFGTLAAIGGLLLAGGEQRPEWRLGMLVTGLLGTFCIANAVFGLNYRLIGLAGPVLMGGLMQIMIAAWGLWPRRKHVTVRLAPEEKSGEQPMLTALLSLAGIALCAGLILAGIAMASSALRYGAVMAAPAIAPAPMALAPAAAPIPIHPTAPVAIAEAAPAMAAPDAVVIPGVLATHGLEVYTAGTDVGSVLHWEPLLLGTALIGAGVAGLVIIAGRRGWLPRELRGLTPRRWLGYGLVGTGLLWLSFTLRALLAGLLPSLPAVGIATAVLLLGWALARRPPPPEQPRVV